MGTRWCPRRLSDRGGWTSETQQEVYLDDKEVGGREPTGPLGK